MMINSNKSNHFILFDCCKLVKGYNRSVICDLQREEFCLIPNIVYDIITEYNGKSLSEVYDFYLDNHDFLDNCFKFLSDNEFIFYQDKEFVSQFPNVDLKYETQNLLENFIIDVDDNSNHNYNYIFDSLSKYLLKVLQIRFFCSVNAVFLNNIMDKINKTDIRTVELILPENENISVEDWTNLAGKNTKIIRIYIFSSKTENVVYEKQATIIFTKENVFSQNDCGKISENLFSCNKKLFSESLYYNSCLNKKASIDVNGFLRNCPNMNNNYGKFDASLFEKIIKSNDFQTYWNINKDKIDVCKDCEFRYMCTDCRAFIKDTENIYSQPAKCRYNPYISLWQGDIGYIPVEDCGTYKKESGFVFDKEKIQ